MGNRMTTPGPRGGSVEQLRPFAEEPLPDNGRSAFSDPAFVGNKTEPVHRRVPWIAGFSAAFVRNVLGQYLPHEGTVLNPFAGVGTTAGSETTRPCGLNPFAGVGTTLVEAVLANHDAVGLEVIGIEIPRQTRVGNSIIRPDVRAAKAGKTQPLYEAVVTLRQPAPVRVRHRLLSQRPPWAQPRVARGIPR